MLKKGVAYLIAQRLFKQLIFSLNDANFVFLTHHTYTILSQILSFF